MHYQLNPLLNFFNQMQYNDIHKSIKSGIKFIKINKKLNKQEAIPSTKRTLIELYMGLWELVIYILLLNDI